VVRGAATLPRGLGRGKWFEVWWSDKSCVRRESIRGAVEEAEEEEETKRRIMRMMGEEL